MTIEKALKVLDDMSDYVSEYWEDEKEIENFVEAVESVKKVLGGNQKCVGEMKIGKKEYLVYGKG